MKKLGRVVHIANLHAEDTETGGYLGLVDQFNLTYLASSRSVKYSVAKNNIDGI